MWQRANPSLRPALPQQRCIASRSAMFSSFDTVYLRSKTADGSDCSRELAASPLAKSNTHVTIAD